MMLPGSRSAREYMLTLFPVYWGSLDPAEPQSANRISLAGWEHLQLHVGGQGGGRGWSDPNIGASGFPRPH